MNTFRDGMDENIVGSWNLELSQLCLLIGWIIYKWEEIESKLVSNFGCKWKGMSRVSYSIISNADNVYILVGGTIYKFIVKVWIESVEWPREVVT